MPELIAIFGPTGVGKTAVAVELADLLRERGDDPVAVSADALQVYEGLGTLTGAADAAQRARLDHRLIGHVPVSEEHSVGAYAPMAHAEIDAALGAGRTPIVVGGTGLYLRAALTQLDLRPPAPAEVRSRWERELKLSGPEALHAELSRRDPERAAAVAPADRKRLVRLLELSDMGEEPPGGELWTGRLRRPATLAGLTMERDALYALIDRRMAAIFESASEEVKAAEAAGASRTVRAALGYEEVLNGDLEGLQRRTRRLAKRQLTWLRRLPGLSPVDMTGKSPGEGAREVLALAT